ncbi:hypothetical protein ACOMHN_012779 [Nucella lapillus]
MRLEFLVSLYFTLSNKNPAKKVLSSSFKGLASPEGESVLDLLCRTVEESCEVTTTGDDSSHRAQVRHLVDTLAALMDNFALATVFLARARDYFFQQFRQGGQSAVQTNAVMHDCHVTMQALNRLTQRHLPRGAELSPPLTRSALVQIMQADIVIMLEDQMMVDCRCCCAISLVLLLQMFAPDFVQQFLKSSLALEASFVLQPPLWLTEVPWSPLTLPSLPPMASLTLLWGQLSMLDFSTLSLPTPNELVDGETSINNITLVSAKELDSLKIGEALDSELCSKDSSLTGSMPASVVKMMTAAEAMGVVVDGRGWRRRRVEEGGGGEEGEVGGLVLEVVLERLVRLGEQCHSTGSRVQCIKTLTLWATRMMSCLRDTAVPSSVRSRLRGDSPSLQKLLTYVWTHWDDQLDVFRQNSRMIFDSCLKVHTLASQCNDPSSDPFLLSLVDHVLRMEWGGAPCKFPALSALVGVVGPSPLLHRHPHLPSTLLMQMDDQATACHASELYEVLIGGDKKRGGATGQIDKEKEAEWLARWIDPIITFLCSSHKKLKQHIIEYILPKVMKNDKAVLEYMLSKLSSADETGAETQGALIVCLRRARAWGLMAEAQCMQDGTAPVWTKILSALTSPQEQVRLDAFALLCENKRTAEPVSQVEFDHVRHFITNNLNNQTPAFRQAMLAFTKKTFLSWLEEFLFSQLYPTAAFARRTMSLAILSLLTEEVHGDKDPSRYRPLRGVTLNHMHTLLECLTDTFDENKAAAFRLLQACISLHPGLLTGGGWQELYESAMQLAVSTRPQDCGTAAYVFRLLLLLLQTPGSSGGAQFQGQLPPIPSAHRSLLEEASSVQGNRRLLSGEPSAETTSKPSCNEALKSTDAELTQLVSEMTTMMTVTATVDEGGDVASSAELRLLQSLLTLLAQQVSVAQTSLILAAASRPMYPTLHCIRCVLDGISYKSLKEEERQPWAKFVNCLLHVCLKVAEVVSPVVQNSSPEGNIPDEAILGPGLKFDLGLMAQVEESRQTVARMPEYLVVCCWRSIKEVSLLLGHLCLHVPVTQPSVGSPGLLSFHQMEEVGAYFKQQLMESLHRGAFELAYAGFIMLCQRLWKSPWSELQTLPRRWLEEVMTAITSSEESSSALCATRRSAGVPFFIQAIVATEATSSGRPSFHQAMGQLLTIAQSSAALTPSRSANTDAQVHALNVLRALFKDSRLGEDVAIYISDGLKASILGFKSQYWEVRNSATLLLSALMTRIFGVKRSKDESVLSKRNSQTGRSFFHKYPDLYPFLLTELEMATQNLGSSGHLHLHPSLYPVLMVLGRLFPSTMECTSTRLNLAAFVPHVISVGRLFPSTMECTSTRLNLAAFVPHVIRCSSSPVYKTRVMAARALQPLVGKDQLTQVLASLMASLPARDLSSSLSLSSSSLYLLSSSGGTPPSQSHIHGLLLQVYHLVSLGEEMTGSMLQTLVSVCLAGWLPRTWLITRHNPCLCTRKVALDITGLILSIVSSPPPALLPSLPPGDRHILDAIFHDLLQTLTSEVWSPPPPYSPHTPFLSEMLGSVARLAMRYLCVAGVGGGGGDGEGVVLRLLGLEAYEVHLAVLDWLLVDWGKTSSAEKEAAAAAAAQNRNDVTVISTSHPRSGDGHSGVAVTTPVVDRLLDMGLEDGAHPETVVKVFEKLLIKLQKEKRADVKASLTECMGSILPYVYRDLGCDGADSTTLALLREWSRLLSGGCHAEQPEDLQLSCAGVLLDNWQCLLVDREGRLGGTHPEEALGRLISALLRIHGGSKLRECVVHILSWVKPQVSHPEDGTERLFDKGELNTFQDSMLQDALDVMTEKEGGLGLAPEGEKDSLQSVFLRGSAYGERVVFLIQLGLLVQGLRTLPGFWSEGEGARRGSLCRRVRECVRGQVVVSSATSCNFLLGSVVESL